jgi:hypothetical protein
MSSGTHRAILGVFLLTTMIFAAFTFYTTSVYFTVFRGVRIFSVTTPQFQVRVVNSSYIATTTKITVRNPSELTFELRQMVEALFLGGEFILAETVSIQDFMQIEPESIATLTIKADIPSHKVSYVETHVDETWLVYLRLFLNAPLVDGFSWANSWFITETVKVQTNAYESHIIIAR